MWKNGPLVRIELPTGDRSYSVVMFAQFGRGREKHASDWHIELLGQLNPDGSSLSVCIGIVFVIQSSSDLSS